MSEQYGLYRKFLPIITLVGVGLMSFGVVTLFGLIILPHSTDTRLVEFKEPDPTQYKPIRGKPIPPMDVAEALEPSQNKIKRGQSIYQAQCQTCHGAEGLGNGPAGTGLNPPPRNFATQEGWKTGYKVTDVFYTLTHGLGGMPAFDYLPPRDRFALAHYVQSLGKFNHGPEDATAEEFLNRRYHLAEGGREPNRVPVDFAIERMLAEYRVPTLRMPGEGEVGSEARLLRAIVHDATRAAHTLAGLPEWSTDAQRLAHAVAAGAPANGFDPRVGRLSPAEVRLLQDSLRRRLTR